MANQTPITPFQANEVPRETAVSRAFPALMRSVAHLIGAERDLDDISYSQDPAYSAWMRDAEVAQETLTTRLSAFHALPVAAPEDRPLQRMAYLLDGMLGHEEPGGARRLHKQMQIRFFTLFQVQGIGASALHRNAMLNTAYHLVTALAALPLFDFCSADERGDTAGVYEAAMQPDGC